MNKGRVPKIPLLVNNQFILDCREKAKQFNDFNVLPTLNFLTDKRIDHITITSDEIISLIRNLNPEKATGSDGISGQMLLLCDAFM